MKRCHGLLDSIIGSGLILGIAAATFGQSPTDEAWYLNRGQENMKVQNYKASAEAYEKALQINPSDHRALFLLAQSYQNEGLLDKAIAEYGQFLDKNPGDAEVAFKEAELMRSSQIGYPRQDIARYYEMSLKGQDNPRVRLTYAAFLAEKPETMSQAMEAYQAVLQKDPQNAQARAGLVKMHLWNAGLLAKKETVPQAIDQYEQALKVDPGNAQAASELFKMRSWQADLLGQDKETMPKAIAELEKLHKQNPSNNQLEARWLEMRMRYAATFADDPATYSEAILLYKAIAKDVPDNPDVRARLIKLQMQFADHLGEKPETLPQALTLYKQLLSDEPNNPDVYQGYIHLRMREADRFTVDKETMPQAIELYEQLVKEEPNSPDARTGLIRTRLWYAGMLSQKETIPQAIDQYKEILREDPHNAKAASELTAMRVWYADVLGEKPETMAEGIHELEQLEKESPGDANLREHLVQMRMWYAGDLGSHKETLHQAIDQYEQVLQTDPDHADAYLGLARAYAWLGDSDKAYHETELAAASPWLGVDGRASLVNLQEQLSNGRAPQVGFGGQYFNQKGTNFTLKGNSEDMHVRFDPTSYSSVFGQVGGGDYWDHDDYAQDRFFSLGGQLRIHSIHQFEVEAGNHSVGPDSTVGQAQYAYGWEDSPFWFRSGFKRELKYDSFLALSGQTIQGRDFGAARSNLGFLDLGSQVNFLRLQLTPYGGWVKAQSLESNPEMGVDASVDFALIRKSSSTFSVGYLGQYQHYDRDQSAFVPGVPGPEPGGYFSPQAFSSQTPRISLKIRESRFELDAWGGPSWQYVKTSTDPGGVHQLGGEAEASFLCNITRHIGIRLTPEFLQIPHVYDRYGLMGSLDYTF